MGATIPSIRTGEAWRSPPASQAYTPWIPEAANPAALRCSGLSGAVEAGSSPVPSALARPARQFGKTSVGIKSNIEIRIAEASLEKRQGRPVASSQGPISLGDYGQYPKEVRARFTASRRAI